MSIEEKKTLTYNQEQQHKWSSNGQGEPLLPTRDRTSTLIESNLKGLGSAKSSEPPFSSLNLSCNTGFIANNWLPNFGSPTSLQQQPQSLVSNYSSSSISNSPQPISLVGNFSTQQLHSSNYATKSQPMSNFPSMVSQQPNSLLSSYPTSPPQSSQRLGFPPTNSPAPSMDLRSLDSLLPNIGPRSTPTLSQLSGNPGLKSVDQIPSIPSPPRYTTPSSGTARNELEDLLG